MTGLGELKRTLMFINFTEGAYARVENVETTIEVDSFSEVKLQQNWI